MLLAMLSIAIFAIPICLGIIQFLIGLGMLIFVKKKMVGVCIACGGLVLAIIPASILGIALLKGKIDTKVEYDSLPGKVQVDANLDKDYFSVDGVGYRRLFGYNGRDLNREETGTTLVYGMYTHFPLEKLQNDSPYELFYTDMFSSTYCFEDEYDQVSAYYDGEAETTTEIRNYLETGRNFHPVSLDLVRYNELFHKYHPKMNYNWNESYFDTERVPLDGDIEAYQIQTITSDGIYETDTRFLLTKDSAYIFYRATDTEAVGVLLLPEEEAFFRDIAANCQFND